MIGGLPDERSIAANWQGDIGQPVVSVLCHAYNQVAYVEAALASILRQVTDFPFELIVRDDGSSDGTSGIIADYAERYPRIVRAVLEKENRYREGIKPIAATFPLARGEFVAFCEGDDYWLGTDKLQAQVDYLRLHPDAGAVHGNYVNLILLSGAWRKRLAFRHARQRDARAGDIYEAMLGANLIQTCTVLYRHSLIAEYRRLGPGVDTYAVGDWPLSLYASHKGTIGFMERPLAAYRRTLGSITNSGHASAVMRGLDAVRMAQEFCDFFQDDPEVRRRALSVQYLTLLWLSFRAGDRTRFELARHWLAGNRPQTLKSTRARVMRFLIKFPRTRAVLLAVRYSAESALQRMTFRRADRRGRDEWVA